MKKVFIILFTFLVLASIVYGVLLFIPVPSPKNIAWGVNFSQVQAEALSLNPREAYSAIINDLGAKNIRIMINWNFVEKERGQYFFDDVDWYVNEAEINGVSIVPVIGMKSGRWPECHLPEWALGLSKKDQQGEILKYIEAIVSRYRGSSAIVMWQVENEPLFRFGECPWYDSNFLKKEVELVRLLDDSRPIIVTDSGEQSLWWRAADIGDIVGTTMYRKVWVNLAQRGGFYFTFPLPPSTYYLKSSVAKKMFGKKVINVELQAEPWVHEPFQNTPLYVQEKSMDPRFFRETVQYAKKSGFDEFYFWGTEWWYWLKKMHNRPEMWNSAREIINSK